MTGARALLSGTIILALVCAVPAVSVAQDSGSPPPDTTTTTADPPAPPAPEPSVQPDPAQAPAGDNGGAVGGSGGSSKDSGSGDSATSQPAGDGGGTGDTSNSFGRQAHTAASAQVNMDDFFYSPSTLTVSVGDIVTWHNRGKEPHTATADDGSFDTGTVSAGQSGSHMFTKAGTFTYYCTIHPNMHGTVRVLAASGGGGGGGGGGAGTSAGTSVATAPSEAAAVASPNAAGDKSTLPATGMAAGALALVGLALLALGLIARYIGDPVVAWTPAPEIPVTPPAPSARPDSSSPPAPAGPGSVAAHGATFLVTLAVLSGVIVVGSAGLRKKFRGLR